MPDSSNPIYKAPPNSGASSFVYPPTEANLQFFADLLGKGHLVAIPTETVYGLAGLALDETACRKIFEVKGRPLVDPLIVHIATIDQISEIAEIDNRLSQLSAAFWPGPLTVILRKKPVVPDLVTAGKPTVAVRIPRHPVARKLLKLLGQPIAAPSANPFGYISPSTAQHVADSFAGNVPYIVDGGSCEIGLESTILDLSDETSASILRPGAISASRISEVLGTPVASKMSHLRNDEAATAPGTFLRHYCPLTKLSLFNSGEIPEVTTDECIIFISRRNVSKGPNVFWLSDDGSLKSVAQSLYTLLRQVDASGYRLIHCELPDSDDGYAVAIRDRLIRAAAK